MKPEGNERLLDLIELRPNIFYPLRPLLMRPLGVLLAKVTLHGERHQRIDHDLLSILLDVSRPLSPMIDSAPQVHQVAVEVGMGDGRCQITDQRGSCAAFGNQALGGVVRRIEIHVG